ncbi:hypothetical protein SteCoe_14769 [Stentor coeruleus]|uniref:Dymeclin n=1 Tax=Stentor coeruleus TaxID=5963 RepID=A0A1R2C5D4_9CILI|nr:hypothetical protein SteCoe_14769 [Stentor coeruleus]
MGNNDSRTIFRDQIQILVNEDIPSDKFEYWDMLFNLSITPSDVYSMIPDADIITLLTNRKDNFLRLLDYSLSILDDIALTQDLTPIKITAGCSSAKILVRLIPFIAEDNSIMWDDQYRGIKIIITILKLMFTSNFAVSGKVKNEISDCENYDENRIWGYGLKKGVNNEQVNGMMWMVRYDLVRILLALCSTEMFRKPNESSRNLYALFIVSKANAYVSQMFYSLVNTVVSFNHMGYWKLPYSSYFNYEYQEKTVQISIQLLCSLTYVKNELYDNICLLEKAGFNDEDFSKNYFVTKLNEINQQEDMLYIYNSCKEILSIVTISQNTYLPGSVKDIQCKDEIILLLWILIKHSPCFKEFLGSQENAYEIIIPLVQMLNSQDFIITSCTSYILLHLSTLRGVSSNLHHPFPNVSMDLPLFYGNYSDFIIIALSRIVFMNSLYYTPLYPYFFMTICNISPYIRSLCPNSSQSLIKLLEKVSTRIFLLESEKNNYLLFYILETINNIIEYQWQASSVLVLNLIRKKETLYKIFQLPERWEETKESTESWKTKDWFNKWAQLLPFDILKCLMQHVIPNLESFTKSNPKASEDQILNHISQITLIGLLPPPGRIIPRIIEVSHYSDIYENAYLWTLIYTKSIPYEIVPRRKIQLVSFSE